MTPWADHAEDQMKALALGRLSQKQLVLTFDLCD